MTNAPISRVYSFGEYDEIESTSELRHEFVDGIVRAMAGGTARHNELALALGASLRTPARAAGCRAHVEGRRLDIGGTAEAPTRRYYPDVMVVCSDDHDSLSDRTPCFVAEVLSDSTATIDQVEKFTAYTNIPSVLAYAVVSQSEHRVVVHRRVSSGFRAESYTAGQEFTLDCPPVTIAVDELYLGL
ncbi:MAG TPA: Uma2 family endonuclease [Ilumatobacter sp.]|nr:Uma2 family endonuclease [Ilumatobacter sp.]